jgi:multiple sugar transport system substrate-binding protein
MRLDHRKPMPLVVSRRRFLQLMGMGGAAVFLGACGGSEEVAQTTAAGTSPTTAAATTAAPAPVLLDFWLPGGSDPFCQGFRTVADAFAASGSGITVEEVLCGVADDEDFNERLLANLAAGTPPDAVVIWSPPVVMASLGALEPLDALMAASKNSKVENWPEGVLASCRWDGQIFGLPATASSYAIFYNEELLESKGIPSGRDDFPKTWDDLKALSAEFVQWDGDTLVSAGMIPPYDAVEAAIWSATNGGVLYDAESRQVRLNSDENIEMLDFGLQWLNEQYKG